MRSVLVEHDPKSDVAELAMSRKDVDNAIRQPAEVAAAPEAIAGRSRVRTMDVKELRGAHRDAKMKPMVRMSRTMKLLIDDTEIGVVLADPNVDSERLAGGSEAMSPPNESSQRGTEAALRDSETRFRHCESGKGSPVSRSRPTSPFSRSSSRDSYTASWCRNAA